MKSKCLFIIGMVLWLAIPACKDRDEKPLATIIGKWHGDKAEFNIKPEGFPVGIPYTLDDFTSVLEFKTDGTLTLIQDGKSSTGTYQMEGKNLTININFIINDIDLSGTYTIKELTTSRLSGEITKAETVKDPNTGADVSGTIKATLYFDKE